ncbi:MAG: replication protein RepA [Pyrinomonadaceae bacterium]
MLPDSEPTVQPPGNRCGHNPQAPRSFEPPERHKARPGILRKLGEKIRAYYDTPAKILPSLNLANGKDSQQRSERREACLQLLGGLIHFLDLVTLRVGIPQADGSFRGLSLPYLAGLSGLELRRAERACHDLVAAGILGVHPIAREKGSGEFTGLPAIRTISQALFRAFNLAQWLRHERDKASKRQRKQERKEEAMGRMELVLKGAAAKARQSNPQSQTAKPLAPSKPEEPHSVIARLKGMLRNTGPP